MIYSMLIIIACCLFLVYFPGYPIWLWWLGRNKAPLLTENSHASMEAVSVLLPAHNDACHLDKKIESLLLLETNGMSLEIIVVLDGCSDGSCAGMTKWKGHSQIKTLVLEARRGKAHALNQAALVANGSMLVFCDASQKIASDALLPLLAPFQHPQVGLVSGCLESDNQSGWGRNGFRRFTNWLRKLEGKAGWLVGAYGPLYAVRRSLFEPLPEDGILDDMVLPIRVVEKGFQAVFAPSAKVFECRNFTGMSQFRRGSRIVGGLFQIVSLVWKAQMPLPFKAMFFMHKFYRLLLLPIGMVGLCALGAQEGQFALWLFFIGLVGFLFVGSIRFSVLQVVVTTYSLLTWPFRKTDVLWDK